MQAKLKAILALVVISGAAGSAAAAQEAPAQKPGPEHQRLGYFVGRWKAEGEVKPGPMGPGGKVTATDNCEWFEGRFTVICRSEGQGPSGPSKSIGILGYSVGFGGSMIWFGSSAGIALSNLFPESRSVGRWLRAGWHVAAACVAGFLVLLLIAGWHAQARLDANSR